MSEDSGFINKKKPQMMTPRITPLEGVSTYAPQGIRVRGVENPQGFGIDERRCGLDFFGSGLTPLSFDVNVRNRIMDRTPVSVGFSTTECTENTEILKNQAGLTPIRPFAKNHKKEVLE